MISQKELRIGNKVVAHEETIITVDKITKDGINYPSNNEHDIYSDDCHYNFNSLSGIPLTPSVLEKCGAFNNGLWVEMPMGYINRVYMDNDQERGAYLYDANDNIVRILYWLHDLQNCFFCLTQNELIPNDTNA